MNILANVIHREEKNSRLLQKVSNEESAVKSASLILLSIIEVVPLTPHREADSHRTF